jgi:hypothetical protein
LHQHAHQRDELPLAHREARAALTDLAVQPVGQGFQPLAVAVYLAITSLLSLASSRAERYFRPPYPRKGKAPG